jgi:hypothetical protein
MTGTIRHARVNPDHANGVTTRHPSGHRLVLVTDVAATDELERLRAENARLAAKVGRRLRWRSALAWSLLVLGCGLAVLALVAVWLRTTMLDTDRYVDTVAPIAAEPAVQRAVADKLETAIFSRIDFAALAREALPERADVIAPAIERGAQSFISERITDFTRSERFETLWVDANRRAHTRLVELLEGGRSGRLVLDDDTLVLDLSPAVERVRTGLQERGLTRIAAAIPTTVDGQIALVQSGAFADAQRGVRLLKAVAIVLPALSLLCLLGAVWLTGSWRRGLLRAGIGLTIAMLLLVAAVAVGRSAYLSALDEGVLPHDAASGIFDALVAFLRNGVRIVVLAAVLVAAVALIAGLPLRRLFERIVGSRQRLWVARQRRVLMIVTGALGLLVLFAWSPLTGRVVLIDLLVVGGVLCTIAALSLEPGDAVADQLRPDDEEQHGHDRGVVGGHP